MRANEETIDAVLDPNGQLKLTHPPSIPPGLVQVTIRSAAVRAKHGLADVIQEIAADQRSRGFLGRSSQDIGDEIDALRDEDMERDRKLDAARRDTT